MINPKKFSGATSNDYKKVIDRSHPNKEMKHNGTRKQGTATSMDRFAPTKPSGYDGMGQPYAKSSDRSEKQTSMTHFEPTKHSKPGVPVEPKKWHKKGYDMTSPS